jgi:methyl-accepting chemotaxis protein
MIKNDICITNKLVERIMAMKLKDINIGTRITGGFCFFMLVTIIFYTIMSMNPGGAEKGNPSAGAGSQAWWLISIICVVWIAIGIFISRTLSNSVTAPVGRLNQLHNLRANGNLTIDVKVNRKDELGKDMVEIKGLIERWREVIGHVKSVATEISSAGSQLSASAEQMSHGSNTQTERTSQVAAHREIPNQIDIAKTPGNCESASRPQKCQKTTEKLSFVREVKKIAETVRKLPLLSRFGERSIR